MVCRYAGLSVRAWYIWDRTTCPASSFCATQSKTSHCMDTGAGPLKHLLLADHFDDILSNISDLNWSGDTCRAQPCGSITAVAIASIGDNASHAHKV